MNPNSPDLEVVFRSLMDVACELLLRDLSASFFPEQSWETNSKIVELTGSGEKLPLAKIIPIVNKEVANVLAEAENTFVSV